MKVTVRCSFLVDVDVADDYTGDVRFWIEENSCPGTGPVWPAVRALVESQDDGTDTVCAFCAAEGKNEVVSIGEVP